jgi:hypothetical protein
MRHDSHNNDFQREDGQRYNDVSRIATYLRSCMTSFGVKHYIALFLLSTVLIPSIQLAHAQGSMNGNTPSVNCQSQNDDLRIRGKTWIQKWGTSDTDPGGQLRIEGKQISSDIGMTLVQCENVLNDHDKLTLTQIADLINAEIDKDVNFGPPCNPNCASGPPVS